MMLLPGVTDCDRRSPASVGHSQFWNLSAARCFPSHRRRRLPGILPTNRCLRYQVYSGFTLLSTANL